MSTNPRFREVLVDTNILVYLASGQGTAYQAVESAIRRLVESGTRLAVARQNLVEFWAVCTKPVDSGGLGLAVDVTDARLDEMELAFHILPEGEDTYFEWRTLVRLHGVMGRQLHDARLVATMSVHSIPTILTKNAKDFRRTRPLKRWTLKI